MAKKLTTEDLVLNIIVNSNKAQSEIGKLGRTIQDNTSKLKAAESEMKKLEKANQTSSTRYKTLQSDVTKYNTVINQSKTRLGELNQTLSLQDKSMKQLEQSLRRTRQLWRQATNDTDRQRYADEMGMLNNRIAELRAGGEQTGNALTRMSSKLQQYFAVITAGIASLMAAFSGVRKATEEYARFDDVLADVMKTTNLAKDSVQQLNAELEKMDTRTSQEDLLGLGRIAGKLGYTDIEEITDFVRANNQIIVALNEDLGGNVEETVNKIGKLVEIFNLKDLYDTEDAFLKVGSAINELGMASTANEGYMVEFARRMAGVAPLAGVTIEQVLGLGAALDQLGQTEEVSSTALSKLFLAMAKDASTYAKYAGMELKEFQTYMETDFMGAFTKVLQGVRENSNGINELAATLGDLGQDGGRVIGVIGSLANNVDVLTGSIGLSNKAMADGTSITDEYNIKNETSAAKLDRTRKEVTKFWRELGEKLWPAMAEGNSLLVTFLQLLISLIGFVSNNIKWISTLTVAFVTYYTAVRVAARLEAITTTYMAAKRAIVIALSGTYALLTGNLGRATAAQRLLNITMAANPIGAVATLIVGISAAVYAYTNNLFDAEKAQRKVNEEMKQAKQASDDLKNVTNELVNTIKDLNATRFDQARSFVELQKLYPNLLGAMSLEEFQNRDSAESLQALNEARQEQEKLLLRTNYNNAVKSAEDLRVRIDELTASLGGPADRGVFRALKNHVQQLIEAEERIKQYGKQIEVLNEIEFNAKPLDEKLEHYRKIEVSLTDQIDKLRAQRELIQEMNKGWNTFDEWVNKIKLNGLISQLETVQAQINSLSPNTEEDRAKEIKTIGDRRKALNEELGVLKEQYEIINEKDIAARRKNLAERKKIQAQLDALDGRSTSSGRTGKTSVERQRERDAAAREKMLADQEKYRQEVLLKEKTLLEQEEHAHQERLKQAGIYGKQRKELEGEYIDTYDALLSQHYANIDKIEDSAIAFDLDKQKKAYDQDLTQLKIKHNNELSEITTLEQAKERLRDSFSDKEIAQVRTLSQARRIIQNQQILAEEALTKEHLQNLAELLKQAIATGRFDDIVLSEDQKEVLKDRLLEVEKMLSDIFNFDKGDELNDQSRRRVDVLGMTLGDWEDLFDNIGTTEEKLMRMYGAVETVIGMFSQYSSLVATKENAMLQKDQDANERKKDNLRQRLNDGTLTQENYNKQVEKLDRDMDKKRAETQRKQAKREKAMALMSAIVNTARAVTAVLPNWILAALVGAFGAVQIGTIASTPLPSMEGREAGGYLKVERSQDGQVFNAKVNPQKRGYVQEPTVIVGENGSEWVASAQAVKNPTVKPIIDVLDTAQRNGTISTMNLQDIIAGTLGRGSMQGRQVGGYVNREHERDSSSTDPRIYEVLNRLDGTVDKLTVGLKNLKAEVAIIGKNGFLEKWEEYNDIEQDANL